MTQNVITLNNPTERARRALIASCAEILPPQTHNQWRVKPRKQWLEAAPEGAIIALPRWGGVALYERNGRVEADEYRLPRLLDIGSGLHWLIIHTPVTTPAAASLLEGIGAYKIRCYNAIYCPGYARCGHDEMHRYEVWAVPPDAVFPDGFITDESDNNTLGVRWRGAKHETWTTVIPWNQADTLDEYRFRYPPLIYDIADVVIGDESVFAAAVEAGLAWRKAIRRDDWSGGNGWDSQRHVICTFDNMPSLGVAAQFAAVTLFDPEAEQHPQQYIVQWS